MGMANMKIKFVKTAQMWCRTWFEGKVQRQKWYDSEEEARDETA